MSGGFEEHSVPGDEIVKFINAAPMFVEVEPFMLTSTPVVVPSADGLTVKVAIIAGGQAVPCVARNSDLGLEVLPIDGMEPRPLGLQITVGVDVLTALINSFMAIVATVEEHGGPEAMAVAAIDEACDAVEFDPDTCDWES